MSDIKITVEGLDKIIFNKRELKSAIRKGGGVVRTEARRLIARKAISSAGNFPGRLTGAMQRSIKVKPGSGGGYVKIMPYMTAEMAKNTTGPNDKTPDFYPAFLFYGTSRGLQPRKNFMVAALDNKQAAIRSAITASLQKALEAK